MDFDTFEEQAKLFCNATGMLPPGKDDSLGCDTREERQKAWNAWCFQRKRIAELEQVLLDCKSLTGTLWPQSETTEKLAEILAKALEE